MYYVKSYYYPHSIELLLDNTVCRQRGGLSLPRYVLTLLILKLLGKQQGRAITVRHITVYERIKGGIGSRSTVNALIGRDIGKKLFLEQSR